MRVKRDSIEGTNALNIDQYTFEDLDKLVQEFQIIMTESPSAKKEEEEDNWEDLEYAEETMNFGRSQPLQVQGNLASQVLNKVSVSKQPKGRQSLASQESSGAKSDRKSFGSAKAAITEMLGKSSDKKNQATDQKCEKQNALLNPWVKGPEAE